MPFSAGFNFRATLGFVTDNPGFYFTNDATSYPNTYASGVVGGWTTPPSGSRDRRSDIDSRIAGICFGNNVGVFRFDLPSAGSYSIELGFGDAGSAQDGMNLSIRDNGVSIFSLGPDTTSGANLMYDATNTLYSLTTWFAFELPTTLNFSSTILELVLGPATSNTCIAHLKVTQLSSAGNKYIPRLMTLGVG